MANDALATGSVVLTANADQMTKKLAQAEQQTKASAQRMHQSLAKELGRDLSQEVGRRSFIGGLLGGAAGGGMMGFGSELIANTIGKLGPELLDAVTNQSTLNREIERQTRLEGQLASLLQRRHQAEDASISELTDPALKLDAMAESMRFARDEAGQLESQLHRVRNRLVELAGEDLTATNWNPHNWFGTPEVDQLKKELERLEKAHPEAMMRWTGKQLEMDREQAKSLKEKEKNFATFQKQLADLDIELQTIRASDIDKEVLKWSLQFKLSANAAQELRSKLEGIRIEKEKIAAEELARAEMAKIPPPWLLMGLNAAAAASRMAGQMNADETPLAEAVEAGTSKAYSLSIRNQLRPGENFGMENKVRDVESERLLKDLNDKLQEIGSSLKSAFAKVGVV